MFQNVWEPLCLLSMSQFGLCEGEIERVGQDDELIIKLRHVELQLRDIFFA